MTDEHGFVGPEGRIHLLRWSKGCYYGRPSECCSLCWLRLLTAPLRRWWSR